jgi:hypothetical protein
VALIRAKTEALAFWKLAFIEVSVGINHSGVACHHAVGPLTWVVGTVRPYLDSNAISQTLHVDLAFIKRSIFEFVNIEGYNFLDDGYLGYGPIESHVSDIENASIFVHG